MSKQQLITEAELAATVTRMESRLASAKCHTAQDLMAHYTTLAHRFEVDLGASSRDVALAKASALMLVQAFVLAQNVGGFRGGAGDPLQDID